MPLYTFECKECRHVHEALYSREDRPDAIVCPKCGDVSDYVLSPTQWVINGASYANGYAGESNIRWIKTDD